MNTGSLFLLILAFLLVAAPANGQTKRKPRVKSAANKPAQQTAAPPKPEEKPVEEVMPPTPHKKNERAATENLTDPNDRPREPSKNSIRVRKTESAPLAELPFVYEFAQPQFLIKKVVIQHDASGKGAITFEKQDAAEKITDPLEISPKTMEKIQKLYAELNFFDSTEKYQSEKHSFAHLGVMTLRRTGEAGKTREATFDWTENKAAKELTEEYKKLTETHVWMFEMNLAREIQPLNTPQLTDKLVTLYNRKMLSDPRFMLPYFREMVNDERLPLVARNQTAKLIARIEKEKE